MKKLILTAAVATMFLFGAQLSSAAIISGGTDFSFTSVVTGAAPVAGAAANTANGATANTGYNTAGGGVGYLSSTSNPLTFTYTFNTDTDLPSADFLLYNGWGAASQAIEDFTLTFFDASSTQVGSVFTGVGSAGVVDDSFAIGSYTGVKSFELHVTSSYALDVEFREVAFEIADVPEPTTMLLAVAGALACTLGRRR